MIRRPWIGSMAVVLAAAAAGVQQVDTPAGRAYKVAFWFEFDRPISSLQFQAYDVAKGEYDEKAVGRWLDAIRASNLRFGAYVRDIRTDGRPGLTEAERLASAIDAEKQRWIRLQSQGSPMRLFETSAIRKATPRPGPASGSRVGFDRPATGAPAGLANQPASPFPYPYRSGPR